MASCRPKAQGVIGCLPVFIGDNNLLSAVQVSICGVAMGAYLGLLGPYYLIHLALPPPPSCPHVKTPWILEKALLPSAGHWTKFLELIAAGAAKILFLREVLIQKNPPYTKTPALFLSLPPFLCLSLSPSPSPYLLPSLPLSIPLPLLSAQHYQGIYPNFLREIRLPNLTTTKIP